MRERDAEKEKSFTELCGLRWWAFRQCIELIMRKNNDQSIMKGTKHKSVFKIL